MRTLLGFVLPLMFASAGILASDWPRFRGPNGTGISDDSTIPTTLGPHTTRWKIELPGDGHSSPIVVGKRIFLAASTPETRMLLCYDTAGKQLWKREVAGGVGKTHPLSSLASATPCSEGERVFIVFWDGKNVGLYAYSLDGKLLWSHDLGAFKSQHGPGFSPIVHQGTVIVNNDQDGKAELLAFEAATGKLLWSTPHKAFRACYSTPIIHDGLLLVTTTAGLNAYDPKDGRKKWSYEWKFPVKPLRTVGSSVIAGDLIVLPSGDGDGSRNMIGVRLPKGDQKPSLAWQLEASTPYVPTSVVRDGYLYTLFDEGIAICREASTGKETWRARLGGKVSASPVRIGSNLYVFGERGDVTVFEARPDKFVLVSRGKLGENVMASPAVGDGLLIVRGAKHLYAFGDPKRSKE
ncbi:MAG: PQQ-binding-like beta-propeller repeat protein [Gemmataceae bacterium]